MIPRFIAYHDPLIFIEPLSGNFAAGWNDRSSWSDWNAIPRVIPIQSCFHVDSKKGQTIVEIR